ncbi:hypothetical protein ACQCT5_19080 [Sutcliffiella halmapala]
MFESNKTKKYIVVIITWILIYGVFFIISLQLLGNLIVYPNIMEEGLNHATIFGIPLLDYNVTLDEFGYPDVTVTDRNLLYNLLPFIFAGIFFLIGLILVSLVKKFINKLLI